MLVKVLLFLKKFEVILARGFGGAGDRCCAFKRVYLGDLGIGFDVLGVAICF